MILKSLVAVEDGRDKRYATEDGEGAAEEEEGEAEGRSDSVGNVNWQDPKVTRRAAGIRSGRAPSWSTRSAPTLEVCL